MRRMHQPIRHALPGILALAPAMAFGSLGPFEHGSGIKAMGAGGVSYVGVQETTALSANPALAAGLGRRYDIGVDAMLIKPHSEVQGNAVAPDGDYPADGRSWYFIPQVGISAPISDQLSLGVTLLAAGLGPDYPQSLYQRFGSAQRASLTLGSTSLATVLAWRPVPAHSFGAGLIVGYQTLDVKGLQFLGSTDPQFRVSAHPDQVTNHGTEGGFSVGFSLGWTGQLTDTLSAGLAYRSKAWTQKLDDYRGLLPDGGALELPAVYGAAVEWRPLTAWTLAVEWQRFEFASEKAFGNPIANLSSGNLLGSENGPGFGLDNQNAYKLGVSWQARPDLSLRGGYVKADQSIQKTDTLFAALAPVALTTHYTVGASYLRRNWEFSGAIAHCPRRHINGEGSIPASFGGGEANVDNRFTSFAVSIGKRF